MLAAACCGELLSCCGEAHERRAAAHAVSEAARSLRGIVRFRLGVRLGVGRDEPEQEPDELLVGLHDAREATELVEEHRVRERARGALPPVIDDADDLRVVGLREGSGLHGDPGSLRRLAARRAARCTAAR